MGPRQFLRLCLANIIRRVAGPELTILEEYVQALLDQEIGVENDESVGEREDIITGSYFEEIPDRNLQKGHSSASQDLGFAMRKKPDRMMAVVVVQRFGLDGSRCGSLTRPLCWSLSTAVNGFSCSFSCTFSCIARFWPLGSKKVEGVAIEGGS